MKKTLFTVLIVLFASTTIFAEIPTLEELEAKVARIGDNAESFMSDFAMSAMNAASTQHVYADSHIGKVFPSIPPHFAAGINGSFTQLDLSNLKALTSELGLSLPIPNSTALPYYTADARVGGFFLPFDVGVSFIKTPNVKFFGMNFDYLTVGADVRYAVLQENLILPNVSIGAGYYLSTGNLGYSQKDLADFGFKHSMNMLSLTAQVSKNFIFVTPFVGGRFIMAQTDNEFSWNITNPTITQFGDIGAVATYSKDFAELYSTNVYAGLSFNIAILRLTASASYDINHNLITGSFSTRVQL